MICRRGGLAAFLLLAAMEAIACGDKKPPQPAPAVVASAPAQYREAVALEKAGAMKEAVVRYRDSARGMYGPAALRLASLYDRGHPDVPRNHSESLKYVDIAWRAGEEVHFACSR